MKGAKGQWSGYTGDGGADALGGKVLQRTIDANPGPILLIRRDFRVMTVNRAAQALFQASTTQVAGAYCHEVFSACARHDRSGANFDCPLCRVLLSGRDYSFVEEGPGADGDKRIYEVVAAPLDDEQGLLWGAILSYRDVTERVSAEARLEQLAYHDPLTGLQNRTALSFRLEAGLAKARQRGGKLALLWFDLDSFKRINDTLGHAFGDRLLQETAGRLRRGAWQGTCVARWGGDEFVLLMDDVSGEDAVEGLANSLLQEVGRPLRVAGEELRLSASIGGCVYPGDGIDAEELLAKADMALHEAKAAGKSNFRFYRPGNKEEMKMLMQQEAQLYQALEQGQFALHYQPQVRSEDGGISAVEALLRWYRPGEEAPRECDFIPLCEEIGLIHPLGRWVLKEACTQARRWQRDGGASFRIAVNLSPLQLRQPDFVEMVEQILWETGLEPDRLELELTESSVIEDLEEGFRQMKRLRGLGVRLVIDDFGKGFSSLSRLKDLVVDKIKIDRSFIANLEADSRDLAIVEAVVTLAKELGVEVVAEGVEKEGQRAILQKLGCDGLQGYLLGRPQGAEGLSCLSGQVAV